MENIYQKTGNNIRKQRKKLNLTQENIAEVANISSNFLGQIERGTKKASLETIQKIANGLKIPVSSIFQETDETFTIKENNEFDSYVLTGKLTSILKSKSFLKDLRKLIIKQLKKSP